MNSKMATKFLNVLKGLSGDEKIVLCYFSPDNRKRFFREFDGTVDLNEDFNIYYTLNPRDAMKSFSKGQGTKDDIKKVVGFFCDLDCGAEGHTTESFYKTKDDALKAVRNFFVSPTHVIDSGHGLQVLWLFERVLNLGKDISIEEYEEMNGKIQNFLKADYTKDASRILRLPGSLNVKNPGKPVAVKLIAAGRPRCTFMEFVQLFHVLESTPPDLGDENVSTGLVPDSRKKEIYESIKRVEYNWRLPKINERIKKIIKYGKDIQNPGKTDRSCLIQSAVDSLVLNKYSPGEIYSILTNPKYRISEKILEQGDDVGQKRYVALSIFKSEKMIAHGRIGKAVEDVDEIEKVYKKKIDRYFKNFIVLGKSSKNEALIWSDGVIQHFEINRISKDDISLLSRNADLSNSEYKLIKKRIIEEMIDKGFLNETRVIRNGIWYEDGGFGIISGKKVLSIDDGTVQTVKSPVFNKRVLIKEDPWLDSELFVEEFKDADLTETYLSVYDLVGKWNWTESEMTGIMTCFVMLAPFQQAMTVRPWIYILASPGAGKTKFFEEVMQLIHGKLTMRLDNSTANGVNQTLTFSGYIPLFDNFEPAGKTENILSAFESTTSKYGSAIWRGGRDLRARKLHTNHMLWLNSVSSVSNTQARDSRTVQFKIKKFKDTVRFLPAKEAKYLQCRIIASVIKNWEKIRTCADKYIEKYHDRIVELISYPLAIQEIIQGSEIPESEFPSFVMERPKIDDAMQLLTTILFSTTNADYESYGSPKRSVCEILLDESVKRFPLKNKGLRRVKPKDGGEYLAVYPELVRREILRFDNRYKDNHSLDAILEEIEGAFRKKQRVSFGKESESILWNILIPFDYVTGFHKQQKGETD